MFAKSSALVVRSLFVAAIVGSLVACTFDQPASQEPDSSNSSAISQAKRKGGTSIDASAAGDDDDASCGCGCGWGEDGGVYTADASVDIDGGPYEGDDDDTGADGGIETSIDASTPYPHN